MRTKSSSSAEEQARSAETQRGAEPERTTGKLSWLAPAVGLGALALCSGPAYANYVTAPGETVGLALGAPLPEGVYFADTSAGGSYRGVDDKGSGLSFTIPVIAWSTPWTFLGGREWGYVAAPAISAGIPCDGASSTIPCGATFAGRDFMAVYSPAAFWGLAWDLGQWGLKNWGISWVSGGYAPVDNELRLFGHDIWTGEERAAVSYTGDKWNLTAHLIYATESSPLQGGLKEVPDNFIYDLTAVKTLGKWEIGAVAFGEQDLQPLHYYATAGQCGPNAVTNPAAKCEQALFAAGGLIGYDFPGVTLQLYATSDIWTQNYRNLDFSESYEKRVWVRAVIPLWIAPKEEAPMK